MNQDLLELERIAHAFLDPQKHLHDLLPEAQSLRDLLERRTHFEFSLENRDGMQETRLDSGLAIAPTMAAMCLRELYRTPAFIRGLGAAISDSLRPERPVHVLYAGCGPYALLALPLMTAFSGKQVAFTLLDIHQQCLDDAMELIASLGLADRVAKCICADAARYEIPADEIPDVVVSETMSVTLHNEPQVSIARNLMEQAPAARMVPQSVRIEACLLNGSREHVMMPSDHSGEIPAPQRDRILLGRIFELDARSIRDWTGIAGERLPAGSVKLPSPLDPRYHPYLRTHITVYGDTRLLDYESSLTIPQALPGKFHSGEELQFHYQLGNDPELRYHVLMPQGIRKTQHTHVNGISLFRQMPPPPKTPYLRLPLSFDERRLNADLAQIRESEWVAHFNTGAYDRDWRCVPLRSVDGKSGHIQSLHGMDYADTELLARCPYFREVLAAFECHITSARLMSLGSSCRIRPHRDNCTAFEDGIARLHIPIVTAPDVLFTIEGEDIHFSAGHTWYLNANCLHGVYNGSPQPRIHLMLDCIVNPWLEEIFMDAGFEPEARSRYGDASINDDNVEAVIANLMLADTEAGRQLATQLAGTRNSPA